MLKNQKGITLVALVVTIVILIILATISITVALQSGLMNTAKNVEQYQANADQQWEDTELNILSFINAQMPQSGD